MAGSATDVLDWFAVTAWTEARTWTGGHRHPPPSTVATSGRTDVHARGVPSFVFLVPPRQASTALPAFALVSPAACARRNLAVVRMPESSDKRTHSPARPLKRTTHVSCASSWPERLEDCP